MNKYKICIYAICKNESKFVERWCNSIKDADYIVVLDTGSTDNTVDLLKKHNIKVFTKNIIPWRFDVARNESIKLIPEDTDICICLDLDEIINNNWRQVIENVWKKDTNRLKYIYNWKLNEKNEPIISFYQDKIHSKNYKWVNPVHEILKSDSNIENYQVTEELIINHYPDNNKSRSSYLKLLELSVKEDSNNDRNMHYLGREYMYYKKWNKCIDTLIKHLNLKTSTWKDERSASMRFISRSYINLNRYEEANMWLDKAIKETSYLRDPYVEKALLCNTLNKHKDVIKYCNKALKIKNHEKTYINEPFSWDNTIYDLLSISYYYLGNYKKSLFNINKAIKMKSNKRLINNKKLIQEKIKSTQ